MFRLLEFIIRVSEVGAFVASFFLVGFLFEGGGLGTRIAQLGRFVKRGHF
jgi:hypothetical protein